MAYFHGFWKDAVGLDSGCELESGHGIPTKPSLLAGEFFSQDSIWEFVVIMLGRSTCCGIQGKLKLHLESWGWGCGSVGRVLA